MPRPEKVQAVEEIKERFTDASATFITEYRGLTVGQQQKLRNSLRDAGASYKVFKITLTKRAFDDLGTSDLAEFLVGPTAIAFANDDPVPVAKALSDFGAEHEALIIKAGWLNGEVLAPEVVAKLATIETRDVLLAKIAGAAKAPLTKMAGMLGSMTRDAASMFSQLLDKKEEEAPIVAEAGEEPPVDESTDESVSPETEGEADAPDDALPADEAATDVQPAEAGSMEAEAQADAPPAEAQPTTDDETQDQEEPAAEDASPDEDDSAPAEAADDDAAGDDAAEEE